MKLLHPNGIPDIEEMQIENTYTQPKRAYADDVSRYKIHNPGDRDDEEIRHLLIARFNVGLNWASPELREFTRNADGTITFEIRTPYND